LTLKELLGGIFLVVDGVSLIVGYASKANGFLCSLWPDVQNGKQTGSKLGPVETLQDS